MCFLDTKRKDNKLGSIADSMFVGWSYYRNHISHYDRIIWLEWRKD